MRRAAVAVAAAVLVAACEVFSESASAPGGGLVRGEWVWATPAPLPAGAEPVPLAVAPIRKIPPGVEVTGCATALLEPVVPQYRPAEEPPVRYRQNGREVSIVWEVGFSARLNPRLEIVAPDGTVIAREGELTEPLGGGYLEDDAFWVCTGRYGPTRVDAPTP
jgi:hypothetical protein